MSLNLGNSVQFDSGLCIICQKAGGNLNNSYIGRNKIVTYAEIKRDVVYSRLSLVGNSNFFYHSGNECYKHYTHKKTLKNDASPEVSIPTMKPLVKTRALSSFNRSKDCIICSQKKRRGCYKLLRISESERAEKFMKAFNFFKDMVFDKCFILQTSNDICAAGIYYHKSCLNQYFQEYKQKLKSKTNNINNFQIQTIEEVSKIIISEANKIFSKNEATILSKFVIKINNCHNLDKISLKKIVRILENHFVDSLRFSKSGNLNICYLLNYNEEKLFHKIHVDSDPIKECADILRNCFEKINFKN